MRRFQNKLLKMKSAIVGGCSCFCRTVILKERAKELMQIYLQGGVYKEVSLTVDDYSRILDDNVQIFQELKEKLQGKHRDVAAKLNSQLRFGKIEMEQVRYWLKKVEDVTGPAAKDVEERVRSRSNLSDSLLASLADSVRKKIEEMEKLDIEGSQLPDILVVDDDSSASLELQTSKLQDRDAAKTEIMECIMRDEVTKIAIWGMGGIGKTTIMEHIYNQLLNESKLEIVIWITVSQTFDIIQIQNQIASKLNERLSEGQSKIVRAAMLSKMLEKRRPYVLIMDDVWRSFELKDIGIPELPVNGGCKLVLTTRSKEVARKMECRPIQVKTLSLEASLKLFKDKVGDVAQSCSRRDIEETMKLIVEECDGLPLAIKIGASSMKGMSDPHLRRVALNQLRDGKRNVAGTNQNDAFSQLKFSYDCLDQNIKSCFLHCAMYPEDYKIPKEELIEYWIQEELIDKKKTSQAVKDDGHYILTKLEENCLLESVEDGKLCVRMHDLVRDMALYITSPRFMVKAGVALKELPDEDEWKEDLLKVSLMLNDIREIPSSMPSPKCPMLTTLLLARNGFSTIPESVFENMPELKILDFSHYGNLKSLPSSISKLVKLTTLLLRGCSFFVKLPSLSNLRRLKKLDLHMTQLEETPEGVHELTYLKYLDVGGYFRGLFSEPLVECQRLSSQVVRLSKLQQFDLQFRFALKGEEIGGLPKLETFCGRFPTARDMSIFFSSRKTSLNRYNVYVGFAIRDVASSYSRASVGKWNKSIRFHNVDISGEPNLLPLDVQYLAIDACNDVRSLDDISGFQDAIDLKSCYVWDCEGMEYAFSWPWSRLRLPGLESLGLIRLENLNGLFEVEEEMAESSSTFSPSAFSCLEMILVNECPKLKKLLPASLLKGYLQSLSNISVMKCDQLRDIVASEEGEGMLGLSLPKMKTLHLNELPELRSIYSSTTAPAFDSLEDLSIRYCQKLDMEFLPLSLLQTLKDLRLNRIKSLKSVFGEKDMASWTPPPAAAATTCFPLKSISVKRCHELKRIFPSGLLRSHLQNVEKFEVSDCDQMEEMTSLTLDGEGKP